MGAPGAGAATPGGVRPARRETGLIVPLGHWTLEEAFTEGTAMEDTPSTIATLRALRWLGVKVATDDLGKGYSSLSYLKRFPVDVIKIDRSIVEGLGHDRGDSAIVAATIALAHALGLEVIAEGMETEEAVAELRARGCNPSQQGSRRERRHRIWPIGR